MVAVTRYYLALLGHSQRYIPAVLAYLLLASILYSDPHSPVLPLYGVSGGGIFAVSCWLTIALLDIEDPVQRLITRSHARAWGRLVGGTIITVLTCALALTIVTDVWSEIRVLQLHWATLGVGLVVHLSCAALGIAVGLPVSKLLIARLGWTVLAGSVATVVVLLAKWIPLIHPVLEALASQQPYGGPLVLAAVTAVLGLAVSACVVTYVVGRRA